MSLLVKIKSDLLAARKSKQDNAKNLLTSLLSEASSVGKTNGNRESTDGEVFAVIRKFINNGEETKKLLLSSNRSTETTDEELKILNGYLPSQMSKDALEAILNTLRAAHPDMKLKDAMSFLKLNHAGMYDGKLASEIARAVFA